MILPERVETAVAGSYRTFRDYPLNHGMQACPCCHEPDEGKILFEKKLSDLTAEGLWPYISTALTTWGDVNDFKHFLPRIFEVLAEKELGTSDRFTDFVDPENVTHKLRYGHWMDWPRQEQDAARHF